MRRIVPKSEIQECLLKKIVEAGQGSHLDLSTREAGGKAQRPGQPGLYRKAMAFGCWKEKESRTGKRNHSEQTGSVMETRVCSGEQLGSFGVDFINIKPQHKLM